ncbi:GNAT family N-acetyltransferase [Halomonas sp. PAMB 3264]|uniref:GNAT family N-acetyltransferase n=1 Tax=unclassified Halomonas TaxID=2609666 RepID=UPI00289E9790|nr:MULTISPECIES: GNAT family N-acetyltransferase [unclassified Halomonas]WNL39935.1 GNAT family N-acetyltransferase [Halomonas sp. PAMB 3232]WNL43243.1 GNAT family N-acetyltransferase [Halomonas sp. PAMB 3264]
MTPYFRRTSDKAFAADLIRRNMAGYFDALGMHWDDALFARQWREMESYQLLVEGSPVGLLCLDPASNACTIRELQIASAWRSQGLGTAAIGFAETRARRAGSATLRLRVFTLNPAVALYRRLGFGVVTTEAGAHTMEKRLD